MKNKEHELKLKCARLNEIKKQLIAELKLINEELATQSMNSTMSNEPQNKKNIANISKSSKKRAIESPMKVQQGLLHTGVAAEAQEDLLKNYSDNPETEEQEEAQDASWQSVNSAIGNYMTNQVKKLSLAQKMGQ